jgi:hypothetical protein
MGQLVLDVVVVDDVELDDEAVAVVAEVVDSVVVVVGVV